jgi:hypothetical protein
MIGKPVVAGRVPPNLPSGTLSALTPTERLAHQYMVETDRVAQPRFQVTKVISRAEAGSRPDRKAIVANSNRMTAILKCNGSRESTPPMFPNMTFGQRPIEELRGDASASSGVAPKPDSEV